MPFTGRGGFVYYVVRAANASLRGILVLWSLILVVPAFAQSGPIAHWKLDETTGTSVSDFSGNGNTGTFVNSPVWTTTGRVNGALDFPTNNAAVSVPGGGNLANLQTTGMTVALWMKPTSWSGTHGRFVYKNTWWLGRESANTVKFNAGPFGTPETYASRTSSASIALNTWQHVVATWDGSANGSGIHIYINGVAADAASASGSGALGSDTSQNLYLINRPDLARPVPGLIDDVRIYNRVLSATEIQELADSTAPSAPGSPTATPTSSSQISVSWSASTDNVAVTGYRIERCTGASCSNFEQVGTPSASPFNDTDLTAATTYRYRVRATDANTNLSAYSSIASATTSGGAGSSGPIAHWKLDETTGASVSDFSGNGNTGTFVNSPVWTSTGRVNGALDFPTNDAAVSVPGGGNLANLYTTGMTVALWMKPTSWSGTHGRFVYKNTWWLGRESANTVKFNAGPFGTPETYASRTSSASITLNTWQHVVATWDGSANGSGMHIYINGVAADAASASGSGALGSDTSHNLYLINRPDLARPVPSLIDDVRIYNRVLSATEIQELADSTAPSAPGAPVADPTSSSQISVSWSASTDNVAVIGYRIERCSGASCSNFEQVGTPSASPFNDTGLAAATTYRYRVRATDANTNLSAYSSISSATTAGGGGDTEPPTVPSGLTATAVSGSQVNLSWTASSDNVGVTGYLVERCQGSGCSSFAQIATPTTTTFNDTGLAPATSYSYRVRASDAVPNLSGYSTVESATTSSDALAPTAPGTPSGTAVSTSQIDLTWAAATDNVAVTAYLVERCQGASCSSFTPVATVGSTSYSDSGLNGNVTYRYRVRARDAANNVGPYSAPGDVTTIPGAGTSGNTTYQYDSFGRLKQVTVTPQ